VIAHYSETSLVRIHSFNTWYYYNDHTERMKAKAL
jgi:hypothetical protein